MQTRKPEVPTLLVEASVLLIQQVRQLQARSSLHGVPLGTIVENIGRILLGPNDIGGQIPLMNIDTSQLTIPFYSL